MKLIATNGVSEAWADEPFDPATDTVLLKTEGEEDLRISWQSALKFGMWEEPTQ